MPIYDYLCDKCGHISEHIHGINENPEMNCHLCEGGVARRIISASGQYLGNLDSPWTRSSAEALLDREVAKHSKDPIERALYENPNRENLNRYMKHKGLVIAENINGAPPVYRRPEEVDTRKLGDELYRRHRERKRLEV